MGIKEVVDLLTSVGFGSPPAWLRPFRVLSNGEQFRVMVARAIAETTGLIAIDEFTSVVDRQVAKVASHTVQKAIRRRKRQLIAVSCHYDIIEWLQPDWVYQPHTRDFARRRPQARREPPLANAPPGRAGDPRLGPVGPVSRRRCRGPSDPRLARRHRPRRGPEPSGCRDRRRRRRRRTAGRRADPIRRRRSARRSAGRRPLLLPTGDDEPVPAKGQQTIWEWGVDTSQY